MVDLCRAVAKQLTQQLQIPGLRIVYVPVTAANRFEAIQKNSADLLCEPTSVTLSRRELVDFSISTYVDGASLAIRTDGPRDLQAMAGRKIGVLGATTTEQALRNTLKETGVAAEVYAAKTHAEGLALLDDGAISAYFADRDILTTLIRDSKAPEKLMVADNYLTIEAYALALQHGDDEFRLAVDRALSHIYRSGEIGPIFQRAFSGKAKPSQMLQTLFAISALPD
jgi:polar amino acid transport system substrate-binding protein/glutamate/aspartate transport system substrate-binding protein